MGGIVKRHRRAIESVLLTQATGTANVLSGDLVRIAYLNSCEQNLDRLLDMYDTLVIDSAHTYALVKEVEALLEILKKAIDNYRPQMYNDDQETIP